MSKYLKVASLPHYREYLFTQYDHENMSMCVAWWHRLLILPSGSQSNTDTRPVKSHASTGACCTKVIWCRWCTRMVHNMCITKNRLEWDLQPFADLKGLGRFEFFCRLPVVTWAACLSGVGWAGVCTCVRYVGWSVKHLGFSYRHCCYNVCSTHLT